MRQLGPAPVDTALPVLIVDDDDDVREAFADLLRVEGFCVETAINGRDALAHLRTHGASVVFLDLKMPVIDGQSFIQLFRREARSNPKLARTPIVVITADNPGLVPPGIPIVRKPCDLGQLVAFARRRRGADE